MSEIIERFSVGFDKVGVSALEALKTKTHLNSNGDVARAGLTIMYDLVTAEERGFSIVLRGTDGSEFEYSPHRPSFALQRKAPASGQATILPFGKAAEAKPRMASAKKT
jgi:hypothetical protein